MPNVRTIEEAEALCRALAPADLGADVPLYLLAGDDVPERLRDGCCLGWTSEMADAWMRVELEAAGKWQGRGIGILCMVPSWHPLFEVIIVHELAHRLERPRSDVERLDIAEFPEAMVALAIGPSSLSPTATDPALPRWHGHGAAWHRVVCHLAYRLSLLTGSEPYPAGFGAGRPYGVGPAETLRRALGDEPKKYTDARLVDLINIDPPKAFARLWRMRTGETWNINT